jgi:ABC-type methionine transport system ATPase subunit
MNEVSTSLLHQVAYHMGLADVAKSLLSREGAAYVDPNTTNEVLDMLCNHMLLSMMIACA